MIEPFSELPARLGWHKNFTQITFDPDQPYVEFSLTPEFPWCSDKLAERGIVWSLRDLLESVRCPGAYQIVTCECGYAPDAYLEERICVSHPDTESVLWEIDIKGLAPALDDALEVIDGFIRLRFVRDEYETDIRAMLREVQETARTPVSLAQMGSAYGIEHLRDEYPGYLSLLAEVFEPGERGCDLDDFVAMDCDAPWGRVVILPAGTGLEIGLFDDELVRLNGKVDRGWIGRWFTRWSTLAAYRAWVCHFSRRFGLGLDLDRVYLQNSDKVGQNSFVLLPKTTLAACHAAGEHFAAVLQAQFNEGDTAPGVTVSHVRCNPAMAQNRNLL
jgi:hypothetical protein